MKKILSSALSMLLVLSLAACGPGGGSSSSSSSQSPSQAAPAPEESQSAPAEAPADVSGEAVPIRVALFSDGNDMSDSQKNVFNAFTADYPGIAPKFEYITSDSYGSNWNGYLMKIQTMVAANDAPDVIALGLEGVAMLVMNDMALPINDFVESNSMAKELLAMQNEDLMKIFTVEDKLYSIPYEANCVVTHINKDIFAKAGIELPSYDWTWDDFVQICDQLKASGVVDYPFACTQNFFCYQALMYCNGASPLNADWTASAFNSPESVKVAQFFQDAIFKNGYAPEPSDTITDTELMMQERVAMSWCGRWVSDDYNSSEFYDKVWVTTMPNGGGGNTSCAGNAGFVVLKGTQHPEEAMTVAAWCSGEAYTKTFLSTGSLPSNFTYGAEVCEAAANTIDNWEVMYKIYENGDWKRSCDPPEYAELANIYGDTLSILYANQGTAEEILNNASEQIDKVFEKSDYRDTPEELATIEALYKR